MNNKIINGFFLFIIFALLIVFVKFGILQPDFQKDYLVESSNIKMLLKEIEKSIDTHRKCH